MVVVMAAGAGVGLWATSGSAASGYRVGDVTTATVHKTLVVSGSATAVHQANAAFQVAGTVAAVDVSLNQQVTAGETLASLDATALATSVAAAQSTLTAAEAKLAEDEAAQSSSASSTTEAASSTTTTTTTPSASTGAGSGTATLARAQQAVVSAQQSADSAESAAASALAEAQSACTGSSGGTSTGSGTPAGGTGGSSGGTPAGGTGGSSGGTPTGTGTPTGGGPGTSTTGAAATTSTSGGTGASGGSAACTGALATALAAQQQVASDQRAVAKAETALAKLLTSSGAGGTTATGGSPAATGSGANGSGGTKPSGSSAGSDPATGSSGTDGSGAGTSTATGSAAQLASDQASIDSANASLIEAQQKLADAQLTSPISGTVASVGLAVGQAVTAGSTTDAFTIINSGSFQATGTLTPTEASEVKVGDPAEVAVTGASGTLSGTVSRVGPVAGSSSGYTYPFVVALPAGSHGIAAGSSAQITVTLAEAKDARVVPTSAVRSAHGGSYVEVLRTGREVRRPVQVGVVGAEYTQITSGLAPGAAVVLADLATPVPASSSTSSDDVFGTGGAFPGGGEVQVGFAPGGRFFKGPG